MLDWSWVLDPPLAGALNMARDHSLALAARPGGGVLRLYGWASPTVSFGRNEPATGLYDRDEAIRRGVAFVRRPTGGRAVLHDRELTYAVVVPLGSHGGLRALYRAIGRGLVRGLRELGVAASLAEGGGAEERSPRPGEGPCFRRPAAGEVVAEGRKLVGSAQVRLGAALLQHGSLLLGGGQDGLNGLRGEGPGGEDGSTSLVRLLAQDPDRAEVARAVQCGLAHELGGRWTAAAVGALRSEGAERELVAHYGSDEWTWRR